MTPGYHEKQEGSGVGLYLIKRIVTSYGGSISVESELGNGTFFKIIFNDRYTFLDNPNLQRN